MLSSVRTLEAAAAAITWIKPCPPDASTFNSTFMDCAYLDMPVNHDNPSEGTIKIFVRRFYKSNPTSTGIWYNQGILLILMYKLYIYIYIYIVH